MRATELFLDRELEDLIKKVDVK
jgi:hypothetical protein